MEKTRKFSWTKYFSNEDNFSYTRKGTAFYNDTGSSNFYFSSCLFENCTGEGAIYIQRDNKICTLIESSVFKNCSSTKDIGGGSVCFNCQQEGQIVQERTCYYQSIAEAHLAFVQAVKNSPSSKNYAIDVSVFNCGDNEAKGSFMIGIAYGVLLISNMNNTNNKCTSYSSIMSSVDNSLGTCNFSTFRENKQSQSISLFFGAANSVERYQTISHCNIIKNIAGPGEDQILLNCLNTAYFDHCIFLNNIANYMFLGNSLTISDSYVDVNTTLPDPRINVTFKNLREDYDFNNFTHFYKGNCLTEPKEITIGISYLSKFAKCAIPSLLSSQ